MSMSGDSERARGYPLGATGVALTAGGIGLLMALLIPVGLLERVSWELYLDRLLAAAAPPLGLKARLLVALMVGVGFGLIGWIAARLLQVSGGNISLSDLLARIRGERADDEDDAPRLRPFDRHPDAPARRPFSAARDIPAADEEWMPEREEEDAELLLDAQFGDFAEPVVVTPTDDERAARWEALTAIVPDDEPAAEALPETASPPLVGMQPDLETVDVPPSPATPSPSGAEPLDLSIARLDELIARLEAGLARKAQQAGAAVDAGEPAIATGDDDGLADGPAIARGERLVASNDPAFPHDPALAAALATLRKLNRAV